MEFLPDARPGRAVVIGVNYYRTSSELKSCVNDARKVKAFIKAHGYRDIKVLVDDPSWRTEMPTKRNILKAFKWLVEGAQPGDKLFFYFSGHGGQQDDEDNDEEDGLDETICPCDYRQAGCITDDVIWNEIVEPLDRGVRLTALIDACHSGTVLDLPYMFVADRRNMAKALRQGYAPKMQLNRNFTPVYRTSRRGKSTSGPRGGQFNSQPNTKHIDGDVIMFSGCADNQYSQASWGQNGEGSACTEALIRVYDKRPNLTFIELLEGMRRELDEEQVPQLSSSKPIDLAARFTL